MGPTIQTSNNPSPGPGRRYNLTIMEELIVALHMHTVYSDETGTHAELAEAGLRAGVDVLTLTDHKVLVSDIEGYKQEGRRRVPC